ncbi:MAG: NAD(P)-dependent alcohol dehydrogenase [Planctomycetota bacterium]
MAIRAYAANEAGGKFEAFEYDPAPLGADEVDVTVEACGICHSDLSMLNNEWGLTQFPFVGGHEVVGTVAAKGDEVKHLEVGQRVGVGWYNASCGGCGQCLGGDHNLCAQRHDLIVGHHGGFGEKIRSQGAWTIPIPDGIEPTTAGPLFCGGITVFNPIVQMGVKPTDRVGVIGIGGLGHLALQFLNKWGCEVTAFTSTGAKMDEAKELGAHRCVNSRDDDAINAEAGRFDFIMSTVNVPLNWDAYLGALGPKGRLHHVGAVLEPQAVQAFGLIAGQKSISGTPLGAPATMRTMLDFCARHDIAPKCEVYKMSDLNAAVGRLRDEKPRYRVVVEADF